MIKNRELLDRGTELSLIRIKKNNEIRIMNNGKRDKLIFLIIFLFVFCARSVLAGAVISEIMYDLDGSDSGREWIEIFNDDGDELDLSDWKIFENETNHKINLVDEDDSFIIHAGGYAIIADNVGNFLVDWPGFSGIIFDSAFSLKNIGEHLSIRDGELNDINSVDYVSDWGANGDGNSLQKIDNEWVVASPTPGDQNEAGREGERQDDGGENPDEESGQTPLSGASSDGSVGVNWPVDSQIFANAGSDKIVVVGAGVTFSGQAAGLQGEPLENARYLWNFGDGAMAEGKTVYYNYQHPANYIAVLEISSGQYSASDRASVKVLPSELKIIEVTENYVKLKNDSSYEINISGWYLRYDKKTFRFSENTIIGANAELPIPSFVSGLNNISGNGVELLYPNNSVAHVFDEMLTNLENDVTSSHEEDNDNLSKSAVNQAVDNPSVTDLAVEPLSDTSLEVELPSEEHVANIVFSIEDESWGFKQWLWLVFGLAVFAGAGFVFLRWQLVDGEKKAIVGDEDFDEEEWEFEK